MKTKTKTKENKITKLLDKLHNDVDKFYNSETWENYLKFMGMFRRRSVNNQLLIWFFGGEDTIQVMGYQQFINKLNRIVVACIVCRAVAVKNCNCKERQAPQRIPQLAPMTYKKTNDKGEEEEKLYFREVFVFKYEDTEQLEGKEFIDPTDSVVETLDFDVKDFKVMEKKLLKMIKDNGFTHTYKDTGKDNLNGWCDFTNNEIVIQENLSQAQTIKTTIHEIGHMFSHKDVELMRSIKETEAESIAYVVSYYLGLDTSNYSIGYVAGWSGNEDFILKESVARVSKTSKLILDKLGI